MQVVNIHAAKTNLSRLIELACAGEEIVIARNNEPVVKLVTMQSVAPRRQRGSLRAGGAKPSASSNGDGGARRAGAGRHPTEEARATAEPSTESVGRDRRTGTLMKSLVRPNDAAEQASVYSGAEVVGRQA